MIPAICFGKNVLQQFLSHFFEDSSFLARHLISSSQFFLQPNTQASETSHILHWSSCQVIRAAKQFKMLWTVFQKVSCLYISCSQVGVFVLFFAKSKALCVYGVFVGMCVSFLPFSDSSEIFLFFSPASLFFFPTSNIGGI